MMQEAWRDWARAVRLGWPVYRLELAARRRRHWLGLLWIFGPLLVMLAFGFSLQPLGWAREAAGPLPYVAYVVTGAVFWQTFADAVLMPLRQCSACRTELAWGAMTPEQALVIGLFDLTFALLLRLAALMAILAWLGLPVFATILALPLFLILLIGAGLAIGMVAALPGLLIEDIGRALAIALTLGIFASPVFYRESAVALVRWNPIAPWIDAARASMTGQPVEIADAMPALLIVVAALATAAAWLHAGRRHFLGPLV